MATFNASYDLKWAQDTPYAEFKNQADKLGWKSWVLGSNGFWYKLPNTTLVGSFNDMAAAEKAFLAIAAATSAATGKVVIVDKWFIGACATWRANSDDRRAA